MSIKKKAFERFDQILKGEGDFIRNLPVGPGHKYTIISDLHMGDGSKADNFRKNESILVKALKHYREKDYSVILLGDIEEFHQFTLFHIYHKYAETVYNAINEFPKERCYRLFGNHDIDWALEDPILKYKKTSAIEAIRLGDLIIVTHGHQAIEGYEKDLHLVRVGTYFFKFFERLFSSDNKRSITQLPDKKDKIYADWAKENRKIFICGHTHAPIFMGRSMYDWITAKIQSLKKEIDQSSEDKDKTGKLKKERRSLLYYKRRLEDRQKKTGKPFVKLKSPYYFNSGSCIFKDGITNIEIDETRMRLIFWSNADMKKEQIWGDFEFENFLGEDHD